MAEQFKYTKFDERDRYEYLIRPQRVNNGVTPELKGTLEKVDNPTHIFTIYDMKELDNIDKDYGAFLVDGNIAIYVNEVNIPKKIFVWCTIDNVSQWKEYEANALTSEIIDGLMSTADFAKLRGIEPEANKYIHPLTHDASMIIQDALHRFVSDAEKTKLLGIETGANKYIHPATHDATIINETANKQFVSETEKATWNTKATTDYVDTKVASVVNSAPETLNTLDELSRSLGDDPNFATTVATEIGKKVDKVVGKSLSTNDYTNADKAKVDIIKTDGDGLLVLANDGSYITVSTDDVWYGTKVEYEALKAANSIDPEKVYYTTDDDVYFFNANSVLAHIINDTTASVTSTYSSNKIDTLINEAKQSSGVGQSSMIQKTFINAVANSVLDISLPDSTTLDKVIIQVYKFIAGTQNITEILKTFDNTELSNFYYNSNNIDFNGVMKIKDTFPVTSTINTDGYYETELIDKTQFIEMTINS